MIMSRIIQTREAPNDLGTIVTSVTKIVFSNDRNRLPLKGKHGRYCQGSR